MVNTLSETEKRNNLLYRLLRFALIAHCIMTALFVYYDVTIMACFNIISIPLYLYIVLFFKRKKTRNFLIFTEVAASLEVLLHQIFSIICLGMDFGFQYFFFMLINVVVLQPPEILKKKTKALYCAIIVLIMILTSLYMFSHAPIYQLPDFIKNISLAIITTSAAFGLIAFDLNQWEITEQYQKQTEDLLAERNTRIYQMQEKIIRNFADIIEERDGSTGNHIKRTSAYVEAITDVLMKNKIYTDILNPEYAKMVISAAPLHDIGKISISDSILNKHGRLTYDEYETMKTHSNIGGSMLIDLLGNLESEEYIHIATEISRYHHERWDGTGYPERLKGEEIPLSARIMAVADVFDALTSERVYKDKISLEEAYSILESESGLQFDPNIIAAFVKIKPHIREIYKNLN